MASQCATTVPLANTVSTTPVFALSVPEDSSQTSSADLHALAAQWESMLLARALAFVYCASQGNTKQKQESSNALCASLVNFRVPMVFPDAIYVHLVDPRKMRE